MPIGRTCFFRLEIPAYKSEESFKEKLLYAIRHCTAIDADFERAVPAEEEDSAHGGSEHSAQEHNEDDNEDNDEENEGGDDDEGGVEEE